MALVRLYRTVKARYAATAFAGSRGEGRWHEEGTPMVYASDTPAAALLEVLVHAGRPDLLAPHVVFALDAPEDAVLDLPEAEWPAGWDALPWSPAAQALGTAWFRAQRSVVLRVPSVVVPGFHANYLVNPLHPRFGEVQIGAPRPLVLDPRLGPRQEPG